MQGLVRWGNSLIKTGYGIQLSQGNGCKILVWGKINPLGLRKIKNFIYCFGFADLGEIYNVFLYTLLLKGSFIMPLGPYWRKTLINDFHNPPLIPISCHSVSFAMIGKGGNRVVPGPDYMIDALNFPSQAPGVFDKSLQSWWSTTPRFCSIARFKRSSCYQ